MSTNALAVDEDDREKEKNLLEVMFSGFISL